MIGLEIEGKPLMRAYSIASANYEENLEFLSIKVQNGPLTSRLQHLKEGDTILVSRKPVGTLVVDDLKPGKHLYLFGTGTGLAPFMSIIMIPKSTSGSRKWCWCTVRWASELAYADFIEKELPGNEFFGDIVRDKLVYYPTVTREPFRNQGRITQLVDSGQAVRRHRPAAAGPGGRPRHDLRQPAHAGRYPRHAGQARVRGSPGGRAGRLRVRARSWTNKAVRRQGKAAFGRFFFGRAPAPFMRRTAGRPASRSRGPRSR